MKICKPRSRKNTQPDDELAPPKKKVKSQNVLIRPLARPSTSNAWKVENQTEDRPSTSNNSNMNKSLWKVQDEQKIHSSASNADNGPALSRVQIENRKRKPNKKPTLGDTIDVKPLRKMAKNFLVKSPPTSEFVK